MLNLAGPLAGNAVAALQEEMEVNVYGLMRMAQAFAPVLKANGGGAFAQLNSVGSMKSFPEIATYTASKAASYSITQALRETLQEQGTRVVSVHPGPIATDMGSGAGFDEVAEPAELVPQSIIAALKNLSGSLLKRSKLVTIALPPRASAAATHPVIHSINLK